MSDEATKNERIGYGLLTLVAFVPAVVWYAFVMLKVWTWFLVPLGAPMVGLWQVAGISVAVRAVGAYFPTPAAKVQTPAEAFGAFLLKAFGLPAIILAEGFIFRGLAS